MDLKVEKLIDDKATLLFERNKILDNIFKYYNPFYRKKLKKIDFKLDKLDLSIYLLQKEKNSQGLSFGDIASDFE